VDSSGVGYDGARNVRDEEQPVGPKEPNRKQGEETKQSRWGFRGKTVWDWMDLLIVPLVLVVIGLLFSMSQDARQQALENERQAQALAIENQRAAAERELAEQRAQDEALQAYLDQMSQLMLERKLLEAEPGAPVYTLAQARTSTVILRLDAEHNESVTRFLIDSGLAVKSDPSPRLLSEIALWDATLSGAELADADLSYAKLSGADLSYALLADADLRHANLIGAELRYASLSGADLRHASLYSADLSDASLAQTDLRNASLGNLKGGFKADLRDADFRGANLSGAIGATNEELEQQAASLEGATMPNGQKYEEWLKSKENKQSNGSS
jgi:uncharacterized protein YjbI with pentapeptide repeats